MGQPLDLCKTYLDFEYLRRVFREFEQYGLTTLYTVASYYSSRNFGGKKTELELYHAFLNNETPGTYRLIISIHEAWFDRCEESRNNHQEKVKLNNEFNRFMLKVLNELTGLNFNSDNETDSIPNKIQTLNYPLQPPSPSVMALMIRDWDQKLTEQCGPDHGGEHPWIFPTHGYSFS